MVLKQNVDDTGRIARYEARFIAQDRAQKDSADCDETFATVRPFDVIYLIGSKFTSVASVFIMLAFPLLS